MKSRIGCYIFILTALFLTVTTGCKKKHDLAPAPVQNSDTSQYTDTVNKTIYKTVKIGAQLWMAENLKATKYRDGTPIKKIQTDTSLWRKDTTGAYCIYQDYNTTPGLLYNWYAVNNSAGLAPAGWHIATDEEWKTLEEFVGMSTSDANNTNWRGTHEADKLKAQSKKQYGLIQNWQSYNDNLIWSTNESGFTAFPGGCRLADGRWSDMGMTFIGFWWTATPALTGNKAYYRYLDYQKSSVFRNTLSKSYGCSVRCVHD